MVISVTIDRVNEAIAKRDWDALAAVLLDAQDKAGVAGLAAARAAFPVRSKLPYWRTFVEWAQYEYGARATKGLDG